MSLSVNPNTVRDSSLVLDIDPANENTFRGPTTTNQITDSTPWAVYNNYGANITTTLTKTADTYRGFPVYVETITPQNPTTASH